MQTQVALGNAGLPALCTVLQDERGDLEMVRGALECLVLAIQPSACGDNSVRAAHFRLHRIALRVPLR